MNLKKRAVGILLFVIFLVSLNFVFAIEPFNIAGYTIGIKDGWTGYLNATNVSVEIYQQNLNGPPSINATLSVLSNGSGYFNITISGDYLNEQFMYKINLIKYNMTTGLAEYIGPNLPYFRSEQLNNLGIVYFYLRPAITIDISTVGQIHTTEDETKIKYNNIGIFPEDYKTGLSIGDYNENKYYMYINKSDCLILLNESLNYNNSICNLNITNIKDFASLPDSDYFYFVNLTGVQICTISSENVECSPENYTDLSLEGFSEIGGISFNEYMIGGGKFFIFALNGSGEKYIYIYNYTPEFVLYRKIKVPDCYLGKMIFKSGGGFGIGNNSGRYVFYKIMMSENDFSCDKHMNLSENLIVKGFAFDDYFGENYYIVSNQSGSINLTNFDFFVNDYYFRYQFKDKRLGYGIKESFNELKYFDRVYIPADRNYSFMIYPEGGPAFPISIELNNLTYGNNISLGTSENRTIQSISQALYLNLSNLNLTTILVQVSGYSKLNGSVGNQNFDNYTIVAYLVESGNMIFSKAMLPQNMGQYKENAVSDFFNYSSGFYNITLPSTVYGANLLLFATAKKNNKWYGGFRIITLNYGYDLDRLNITLYEMIGEENELERMMGFGENINTSLFLFNITSLLGNGNKTEVTNTHTEIKVDYSDLFGSNVSFSWIADSGDSNIIKLPLLNKSIAMKIFSPRFPPIKRTIKTEDLQDGRFEITLEELKAKKPNGEEIQNIQFRNFKYKNDGSCSVPWPSEQVGAQGCLPDGVGQGQGPVNPFTWVISGGKYDLEMRQTTTNITVHYVNVDLLASQPPDASFDENGNKTTSGDKMKEAWRFGSMGPNIYDYVIIGIPYNDSAINDSSNIKINITKFHDENWQPVWEQGESLEELNGTEYEDYKSPTYIKYINGSAVLCNESDENLTSGLCYKDLNHNMVWFKIPHFSGIEPDIIGDSLISESEEDENNNQVSSSGGGGGGSASSSSSIYIITAEQFNKGYTKELSIKDKIKFIVNNENHSITLINITSSVAIIDISSKSQQAILNIGEAKKFDVNSDSYFDVLIRLNSIKNKKANLTISSLHEKISSKESEKEDESNPTLSTAHSNNDLSSSEDNNKINNQYILNSEKGKINSKYLIFISVIISVVILIIIAIISFLIFYKNKKKKRYF
ncbi:MAG: hypothetical protein QXW97_01050 [Candidatus Pacearchaeota archaeon]